MKGIFKGRRDGVADDLADAAPADESGDSEKDCSHRPPAAASLLDEKMMDIVSRTAPVAAVQRILFLIDLCQCSFREGSGRA